MIGKHALLSASSSHRWLACPPSARLCENYEDTGSEYAQQGTDAHSLCEHKLKLSLSMETSDPTDGLSFYDEEMEELSEKDFLNPEETIELYGLSRRKFYRLLKEKKKNGFTALYGSHRLVIRKEFEKYLDGNPEEREALKNGSRKNKGEA